MKEIEGQMVRICMSICSTDGCNSARTVYSSFIVLKLSILLTFFLHFEDT